MNMVILSSNMQMVKNVKDVGTIQKDLGAVDELTHLCPRCQQVVKSLV